MITGAQIRAARALLKWKAKDLAEESEISWATIQRMESAEGTPPGLAVNHEKLQKTLEAAGIMFLAADANGGPGVRFKQ